jgi:hypothetical protein
MPEMPRFNSRCHYVPECDADLLDFARAIAAEAWIKSWCQEVPVINSDKAGVRARETITLVGASL